MIIKEALGLLGNLMFCIACGKYHASKLNTEFLLDITSNTNFYNRYKDILNVKTVSGNLHLLVYDENDPFEYTNIPDIDNIYIKGYRQSEKYWNCNNLWAKNLFKPTNSIIESIYKKYTNINLDEYISLHIRRGDYLNFQNVFYVYNADYYNNIINQFNDKILIFTDDIQWCKNNLNGNLIFADDFLNVSTYRDDIIDLYTMTLCKDNIINHSSFSWWGAYLNIHENRKVYYTLPWIKNSLAIDIIPQNKDWILIK